MLKIKMIRFILAIQELMYRIRVELK